MTRQDDDVLTTRQAADLLGVALRTVQLWVEAGALPAWKTAGGHRRIAREAVERLRQRQVQDMQAPALGGPLAADARVRLLVVEDDADLLRLYALTVDSWDLPIDLDLARNGFEGLVRLGEQPPDMLITDLMMPGMDGFRMMRALQAMKPLAQSMDILVVTALSPADIADRGGLPAGIESFTKPVPFSHLEQRARRLLAQKVAAGAFSRSHSA
ncbi:response regulator [Ideonella sp.]|jgi:excisionase family DNA binding protein|uniref:response regulator n=1 Tax=Ideonella sp. TaxID=1929293 RepID=UPI0037BF757D